ncbi:AvrE-family type 3 secretion system effector [Pokkaliibacter sp. MBI-7]|uniref:AvrE-family type 3 secretion system effector n=1 Tax=Pokkaliibacter sp. MBI-7 TaxID=3040600 RepID=UPI00244BAF2D|nr:AvrE-family type 3 secretion system effector [Pokkaliibacter sp. MBI-7]MDH2435662.1 AvrE-family type 3 secretion system effector [Pokkaliibacter sp. MBI-7]
MSTRIPGSSSHEIHGIHNSNQHQHPVALRQGSNSSTQGMAISLAREGSEATLPAQLHQRTESSDGQPVGKQKHKKAGFLKGKFGFGKKNEASSSARQSAQLRAGTHPVSSDVNLSEQAQALLRNPPAEQHKSSKSFTSKLMHGMGLGHHKKSEAKTHGESSPPPVRQAHHYPPNSLLVRMIEEDQLGYEPVSDTFKGQQSDKRSTMRNRVLSSALDTPGSSNSASQLQGPPTRTEEAEDPEVQQALDAMRARGPSAFATEDVFHISDDSASDSGSEVEDPEVQQALDAMLARGPSAFATEDVFQLPVEPEADEADDDADVQAALAALQQRGASAFEKAKPKVDILESIPEGDNEGLDDDAIPSRQTSFNSATSTHSHLSDIEQTGTASPPSQRPGKEPVSSPVLEPLPFRPDPLIMHRGESSQSPETPPNSPPGSNSSSSSQSSLPSFTVTEAIQPPQMQLINGKLAVDKEASPHLATLLQQTLGRPFQTYAAHESRNQGHDQLLLDRQGKVFQLSTDVHTGFIALHSSTPVMKTDTPPASLHDHLCETGHAPADSSILAQATGIHADANGNHWRIHEGELYKLTGLELWKEDQSGVKALNAGADQGVYGIKDGNKLLKLDSEQSSFTTESPISAFSVNKQGETALLLKGAGELSSGGIPATICLLPSLSANIEDARDLQPRYAGGLDLVGRQDNEPASLTSIALHGKDVFAVDNENRLLKASVPPDGQTELRFSTLPQHELQNAFGKDVQFEGFTHDNNGELHALVKDHGKQRHACPLNDSGKSFKPGWNLSDVLHIDNSLGLSKVEPGLLEAHLRTQEQDFGKNGTLATHDGALYFKDKLTQEWTKAADNVEDLQRGLDGQPYALQGGKLKKITIDENSSSIRFGTDNVFSLTKTRGNPALGGGPKGVPDGDIKTAAVLNSYQAVTLTHAGELKFSSVRPNTSRAMHPDVPIHQNGLQGEITHLQVDKDHTLFALTDEGKLFRLPAEAWMSPKSSKLNGEWREVRHRELPEELHGAKLSMSEQHDLQVVTANGQKLRHSADGWQRQPPQPAAEGATSRDKLFDNLALATKGMKFGSTGANYVVTAQVGGVLGMETNKISSKFTDRLKAHVFKPSLEIPRPLKTAGNYVQHQWQGREGLKPLYEQEHALFKELEANNTLLKSGLAPEREKMDIKTRLERLDLGEAGQALQSEIESLRNELELSAERQLIKLGKHQGVLDAGGELKLDYKPSKFKDFKQSFNPNRSGHSLSAEVLNTWKHAPASADSNVGHLLKAFTDLNVNMSHQKTEIMMGRQRDPSDRMALVKSRLVLDTLMLQKLDKLIDKAELLSGKQPDAGQLATLRHDLNQLRDDQYEKNQVKHLTDRGMLSHKDVEGMYDSAKVMISAFSHEDHGINLIARAVTQTKDQQQLNQEMKGMLHSLKPMDDVIFTRSYNTNASASVIPHSLQGKAVDIFPGAGAEQKRNYNLEFYGLDDGVEVTISRNLGPTFNGNIGISKNALPAITGQESNNKPVNVNEHHMTFKPDLVAGAGLTLALGRAQHNEFIFNVRGKDIDAFVDGLTSGKITPDELFNKGMEHVTMHGTKTNFSIDLGLNFTARARLDLTDKDGNPTVGVRLGGGLTGGFNLVSVNKDELKYEGLDKAKHRTNDKSGVLNSANAGFDLAATLGFIEGFTTGHTTTTSTDPDTGESTTTTKDQQTTLSSFANLRTAAAVAVDNGVKVRGEVQSKKADAVTSGTMDKLFSGLAGAFKDAASQEVVNVAREMTDIKQQLQLLKNHFVESGVVTHTNDEQYAALSSIGATETQHEAATNKTDVMTVAKAVVAHYNTRHLDHGGVLNMLTAAVAPSRKDALASQVSQMMKDDPAFAGVLNDIRNRPNCYTWVTLELKDEPRMKLEADFIKGKAGLDQVKQALENPENRRIKSITIFETGQHKEGFTTPTLFVGGSSSANVYMERAAGTINFKYGADQDIPRSYTLAGQVTTPDQELVSAMSGLKNEGLEVRNH